MTLYNESNIKSILLILLCLIILSILFCIVTSKFSEGLDNTVGLTDFTHSDPNIKPTPLPDICIGNGNFISQPNSTIPVTATAGYLHSNIGACENECTPERGCFAISFDRASKDVMKKCNIYSGATSVGENTTKAGLLCSRISPTCSIGGYKLNNTSSDLATVIKPNGGESFSHSAEVYCARECNNRVNCIGYLYDNKSKDWLKPCRIFSKNKNGLSTGFPVAGICSSTNIPEWHLAPVGSTTCDSGINASSGECEAIVKSLATKNKHVPGRSMQFASEADLVEPCGEGGWGNVPIGCSSQTGGDWAAHYKTGGISTSVNCNRPPGYQLVCSGKAPPDSSAH